MRANRAWGMESGKYIVVGGPDPAWRESVFHTLELIMMLLSGFIPTGTEIVHRMSGDRFMVVLESDGRRGYGAGVTKAERVEKFETRRSEHRRQVYRKALWPNQYELPADLREI